jgi:lipopolysaccharide/colanic/teichoic acid biosynthesis glycosyltransferase
LNRSLDISGAILGLAVLSPLLLILAWAVKAYDGGPVLYRAKRVGRGGKSFDLLKFRTMVPFADRVGGGITVSGDARVTPIGRMLRRYKLDEVPQLWNVLRGDMSFVGPRPEDPRYVARYAPHQRVVLEFTPGITSPASIKFRNEETLVSGPDWESTYLERILPEKLGLELEYFPRRTLAGDTLLIAKTLREVFR